METRSSPPLPSLELAYRYWFFGWLFRDAARGSWLEREAALRHNRQRAQWLPLYIRRWILLCSVFYALGVVLEMGGLDTVASFAFIPACAAVPVVAVATAGWLVLCGPRSGSG
jgi:hypothetical protein